MFHFNTYVKYKLIISVINHFHKLWFSVDGKFLIKKFVGEMFMNLFELSYVPKYQLRIFSYFI